MTTERYRRCENCLITYSHYLSGGPLCATYNDSHLCPECKQVSMEALANVPKKVEEVWEDYDGFYIEELLALRETRRRKVLAGILPYLERTGPTLIDMKNGNNHHHVMYIKIEEKEFMYSYWTMEHEDELKDVIIKMKMEKHVETGQTRPWRDFQ
jgi:hypothetical protein